MRDRELSPLGVDEVGDDTVVVIGNSSALAGLAGLGSVVARACTKSERGSEAINFCYHRV